MLILPQRKKLKRESAKVKEENDFIRKFINKYYFKFFANLLNLEFIIFYFFNVFTRKL